MQTVETEIGGKPCAIETGLMAKQADGASVVKSGDTVVLCTGVADRKTREGIDFFPLTVDYQERTYSAGKIPGGFFKREGRPSEKEVLTSRLIDRSIRPLFPKGFRSETQGIVSVLSFGDENVSDVMGVTGVSAAMMISDIPFNGPISAVRIGKSGEGFVINPPLALVENLQLELIVAGTDDAVVMVEGRGNEVSENDMLEAIDLAHAEIKKLNSLQHELRELVGRPKREFTMEEVDESLRQKVHDLVIDRVRECVSIPDKLKRQKALDEVRHDAVAQLAPEDEHLGKHVSDAFYGVEKQLVRGMIINDSVRADGRRPDEIRQISCQVGLLPRVHGSALFTRGETQAIVFTTLGTGEDEQKIDALEGEYYKNFLLHYNFPPFSVGEARFLRGPGRREVGHGALAEKAVRPVLPGKEAFPYTIRVVSDILESNGSSSMASVCGASLSLMDAGVPIKAPVAGIAMGLIKDNERTVVLTDILGLEDHLGDMDFKVTGTREGITAFQMDVKIAGIDRGIMEQALEQARQGRLYILDRMAETLSKHKEELSPYAPRIFTIRIKQEKIRDVIGTGGKVIRGIVEETGVKIDIEDDGTIYIASVDQESADRAIAIIQGIVEEPEVGKVYTGKVVRITDFGAFVEILPGTDGLLHISQISHRRLDKVTDELSEGEEVTVKVIEIDKMGRVRLSRKELLKREGGEKKPQRSRTEQRT